MRRNVALAFTMIAIVSAIFLLESYGQSQTGNITGANVNAETVQQATSTIQVTQTATTSMQSQTSTQSGLSKSFEGAIYPSAEEIANPSGFINTNGSLSVKEFIGKKIILVDFWTFLCTNCLHTIPYLKVWYAMYKDQGLMIIGVHTPETVYEKDPQKVRDAVKELGITYPIVLDNNYGTWNSYHNEYWPAMYLIDKNGYIVYSHLGEGDYDRTEQEIQNLLHQLPANTGAGLTPTGNMPTLRDRILPSVPTAIKSNGPSTMIDPKEERGGASLSTQKNVLPLGFLMIILHSNLGKRCSRSSI